MVNCNPETVSTDYDTSDRLYFEPLGVEEVLAICEREQPDGRRDPVRRPDAAQARARARGGGLPHPRDAVRGRRPRRGPRALRRRSASELGVAVPGVGDRRRRGRRRSTIAERDRLPGARAARRTCSAAGAMRVCYDAGGRSRRPRPSARAASSSTASSRARSRSTSTRSATARTTYVAAVMQHVEEAGVHSGDSSCVLPAPSLDAAPSDGRSRDAVRRLAPALGVVGLINVQLALADGELYVLEANPRASRTVPFASQGDRRQPRRGRLPARRRRDARATLDAAAASARRRRSASRRRCCPFARFPGADPVLGPEMRSTGEVMASAADLPTAFAKAERAAGRPLPSERHRVPLGARRATSRRVVPVAQALAGLGFRLVRDRRDGARRSPARASRSSACAR